MLTEKMTDRPQMQNIKSIFLYFIVHHETQTDIRNVGLRGTMSISQRVEYPRTKLERECVDRNNCTNRIHKSGISNHNSKPLRG